MVTGQFADPRAGRETLRSYAERWRASQAHRPTTAKRVRLTLHTHLYPALGARPVGSIRPTEVQALVTSLSAQLTPGTVRTVVQTLRSVLRAAVADRLIAVSPAERVSLPAAGGRGLVIPTRAELRALADALPERYRAVVWAAAGLGLRPGELFGLHVSDVDFLRRQVSVSRQLNEQGQLGPPKTAASWRTIPLPDAVADRLAAHLAAAGSGDGPVFVGAAGRPVGRAAFHRQWKAARERAGAARLRLHDLRHAYASALIAAGESVKTVQTRLGHASVVVTLDTYGHLWPDSDERTRAAIEAFLAPDADSVRTGGA